MTTDQDLRGLTVHVDCLFIDRQRGDLDERARPIVSDVHDHVVGEWDSGFETVYYDDCVCMCNFDMKFGDLVDLIERWGLGDDHCVQVGDRAPDLIVHGEYTGEPLSDHVTVSMTLTEYLGSTKH